MSGPRVVIIGAGPTGLGALHRLREHGHRDCDLYEATSHVGGLARSHIDSAGFTWDMGGHVQFSHYHYFDGLVDSLLGGDTLEHQRRASVWIRDRFVPYPLQHHLEALGEPLASECRAGLPTAIATEPQNFREWLEGQFGRALADVFMLPYNHKVWAFPAEMLGFGWIGERVATTKKLASGSTGGSGWGPNRTFRFPKEGGSGELWTRLAARTPERIHREKRVVAIDANAREIRFEDGDATNYDALISTMPLDRACQLIGRPEILAASRLLYSSVHVVGVGIVGQVPAHLKDRSWIYFPEADCPFYRATVFSSYSPANVPDPDRYWSLMVEVSESSHKPVNDVGLVDNVLAGLRATRLIDAQTEVASTWHTRLEHGYPTPSLERDEILARVLPSLDELAIYSRGRFGAWKYEVSNQDHSFMQGVEVVDRILTGADEPTLSSPSTINAPGKRTTPRVSRRPGR